MTKTGAGEHATVSDGSVNPHLIINISLILRRESAVYWGVPDQRGILKCCTGRQCKFGGLGGSSHGAPSIISPAAIPEPAASAPVSPLENARTYGGRWRRWYGQYHVY